MSFGSASVPLSPQLRRLVGAPDQLVSVERVVLTEGTGWGAPALMVRNPAGVSFEVLLDRALDIGWADARGIPLGWRGPRGRASATRYEPAGAGWCQTFGGGLLSTCGLASTGAASTVDGVHHGLHGRVGHLPAENVTWRLVEDRGDLAVSVTGDVVEAALGAPTLRLQRRIVASCVEPTVRVEDVVTNDSSTVAGHMFRHHLNLGYPVVGDGSLVHSMATLVGERNSTAPTDATFPMSLAVASGPSPERVLYGRSPSSEPSGVVEATAPDGSATVRVTYGTDTFPMLVLWRDATAGVNVLGIEPSTSRDSGRAQAERDGEVCWLQPGESRSYRTEVSVR
ncbi:aldose 1-epimerase family protein [Geodermatophilus obscurus]|uniref:Galactose mutarotase n=1 Tax=Geodermatophilus obscurus (strain ATCC 25078 / DSM 43160 / JCM 3152 / CCUG 61914 / KCC A-0152 / KCTC 9177 / NBRC 13315 / NRRL B-3577 / G-20) TaxID=526225 RepID=D2S5J5_GEOOG|nr:conserved hypothetical protein [Geodermatophilus obscurus DSM 43160]